MDVGHGDGAFEGGGHGSGGDGADGFAVEGDGHALAGGAGTVDEEADEFLFEACGFEFSEGFDADEFFFEIDGPAEASGEGVGIFGEFVAVEGHAGFEAEGVACAEAGGFEDLVFTIAFEEVVDGEVGGGVPADDFRAIFAGVSGAEDGELDDHHVAHVFEVVAFDVGEGIGEDIVEELDGFWALNGDHGGFAGFVIEIYAVEADGVEVSEKFFTVGGVADHIPGAAAGVGGFVDAGDDDVVEDAAGVVADE